MFHNTARGAEASALVYSIPETAKLNNLRPYYYFRHILTGCRSCAIKRKYRSGKTELSDALVSRTSGGMPKTTSLIRVALIFSVRAGFDVYDIICICISCNEEGIYLKK